MTKLAASIWFACALFAPTLAMAYVGPGAGLSLLGALWALIAAVATALFFVIAWPIRKAMRRRRGKRALQAGDDRPGGADAASGPASRQERG